MMIRPCRDDDLDVVCRIINATASTYEGAIPPDFRRQPCMPAEELAREIEAGVVFTGFHWQGRPVAVVGMQDAKDVTLVRHAYGLPCFPRQDICNALLDSVRRRTGRLLVGTWAAATWAIAFYQKHGFRLVPREQEDALLRNYWNTPRRQIEASVVLVFEPATGHRSGHAGRAA